MEPNLTYWASVDSYSPRHELIISSQRNSILTNFLEKRPLWDLSIENALFVTLGQIVELAKEPMVEEDSIIFDPLSQS